MQKTPFSELLTHEENTAYQYPPLGGSHEIESFNKQSVDFNQTERPDQNTWNRILDRAESYYSHSKWRIREDFLSDNHIIDTINIVMTKNKDKNPGAIYTRMGMHTNVDVLTKVGLSGLVIEVKKRLYELETSEDTKYSADPVRIFQKPEGHKMSKVAEKRWRLIWGVSLIDQIIDRLLYLEVNQASLDNAAKQAAKPGINFKSGGIHRMVSKYNSKRDDWSSYDARSFDFTVGGDQLDLARELNSRLCLTHGPLKERWETLSKAREEAVKFGKFVFSDGTVCKQILPGVQKSGRFTTIDGNCKVTVTNRIRYDISREVPSDPNGTIAMGDDTVENNIKDPSDFIKFVGERCGNKLKLECEPGPFTEQSFCSTKFKRTKTGVYVGVPQNFGRCAWTIANLAKKKCKTYVEALTGYCIEYAFHEKWELFYNELVRIDPISARSRQWYEQVHLREETSPVENRV